MMLAAANKSGGFSHLIYISPPQDCPRHHTLVLFSRIQTQLQINDDDIDINVTLLHIPVISVASTSFSAGH